MVQSTQMGRRAFLLGALAGSFALATPILAQSDTLSGLYRVEGRNPDGAVYSGRAVLGQQGAAVQINWTVGNQTYAGSGVLKGNVLTVDWGQSSPVIYVVMPNGALFGTWHEGTALERLLPQ